MRATPLRGWPDRERSYAATSVTGAAWASLAAAVTEGIQESAGLAASLERESARIRLSFESPAEAAQFAAGLRAEHTPAQSQVGSEVWFEVAPDYAAEELTHLVLGVTKVAHYLGLRHAGRATYREGS